MEGAVLLGISADDIEGARSLIETALRCQLAAHESYYRGGCYFRGEIGGVEIVLQENFIEDDGQPTEAEFPGNGFIVYVDGPLERVESLCDTLSGSVSSVARLRPDSF